MRPDPPSIVETLFASTNKDGLELEMVKLSDDRYAITRGKVLYEGEPYDPAKYEECVKRFWKLAGKQTH